MTRRPTAIRASDRQTAELRVEVERLENWLHYIGQTTTDDNVRAAVQLAEAGEDAEFEDA